MFGVDRYWHVGMEDGVAVLSLRVSGRCGGKQSGLAQGTVVRILLTSPIPCLMCEPRKKSLYQLWDISQSEL